MCYIHEKSDWSDLRWEAATLLALLSVVRHRIAGTGDA